MRFVKNLLATAALGAVTGVAGLPAGSNNNQPDAQLGKKSLIVPGATTTASIPVKSDDLISTESNMISEPLSFFQQDIETVLAGGAAFPVAVTVTVTESFPTDRVSVSLATIIEPHPGASSTADASLVEARQMLPISSASISQRQMLPISSASISQRQMLPISSPTISQRQMLPISSPTLSERQMLPISSASISQRQMLPISSASISQRQMLPISSPTISQRQMLPISSPTLSERQMLPISSASISQRQMLPISSPTLSERQMLPISSPTPELNERQMLPISSPSISQRQMLPISSAVTKRQMLPISSPTPELNQRQMLPISSPTISQRQMLPISSAVTKRQMLPISSPTPEAMTGPHAPFGGRQPDLDDTSDKHATVPVNSPTTITTTTCAHKSCATYTYVSTAVVTPHKSTYTGGPFIPTAAAARDQDPTFSVDPSDLPTMPPKVDEQQSITLTASYTITITELPASTIAARDQDPTFSVDPSDLPTMPPMAARDQDPTFSVDPSDLPTMPPKVDEQQQSITLTASYTITITEAPSAEPTIPEAGPLDPKNPFSAAGAGAWIDPPTSTESDYDGPINSHTYTHTSHHTTGRPQPTTLVVVNPTDKHRSTPVTSVVRSAV